MDKHPIAAYLEHIGASLPNRGSGWRKMKCPFHEDSHASAAVNYDKNRFKCFGCQVSGDIYDLIMYKEGGKYREALEFAETLSPAGSGAIRSTYRRSTGVSSNSTSIGRRSQTVSFGSSKRPSTRSRDI